MGGDDAAGLLEIAELERDGRADDHVLPVIGDRQAPHPLGPVVLRARRERAAGRRGRSAGNGSSGPMHEMERPCQHEGGFAVDIGQRRIGGEPDHRVGAAEAHMVAADRFERHRDAVMAGRPHPDGDPRQAGDRLDDPHELRRAKDAVIFAKPRREIRNPDRRALVVGQDRGDDSGVAHIFGGKIDHALEHDIAEALLLAARQQAGKDRVAVEARIAPPYDPAPSDPPAPRVRPLPMTARSSPKSFMPASPAAVAEAARASRGRPADHRRCPRRLPFPARPNSRSRRASASRRTPTRR